MLPARDTALLPSPVSSMRGSTRQPKPYSAPFRRKSEKNAAARVGQPLLLSLSVVAVAVAARTGLFLTGVKINKHRSRVEQ